MSQRPTQELESAKPVYQDDRSKGPGLFTWVRQTARLWGFLAFILLVVVIFRQVTMPFVLAALVTYVLAPLLKYFARLKIGNRAMPRFASILILYVVILGLAAVFFTSFVPRVSRDLTKVIVEAPAIWKRLNEQWVPKVAVWVQHNFGTEMKAEPATSLPTSRPVAAPKARIALQPLADGRFAVDLEGMKLDIVRQRDGHWLIGTVSGEKSPEGAEKVGAAIHRYVSDFVSSSQSRVQGMLKLGQRFVVGILSTITTFILVLMISAFLLLDTEKLLAWFRNLVPGIYHADFDNVIVLIDRGMSGAIRGQLIICLVNGILTYIGLNIFSVNYPLLLALLAGVMSLIPIFGSILSSIPIIVVALVSGEAGLDVAKGLAILFWIIGIHLLEANLLNPKIIGTAAKIHPVVVIFAVVAGEQTYGPLGALIAVPLVSAVQAVFVYMRLKSRGELEPSETAPTAS